MMCRLIVRFVLVMSLSLLVACDRYYQVQGTVAGPHPWPKTPDAVQSSTQDVGRMPGVLVTLYYYYSVGSATAPEVARGFSNNEGEYRLAFPGPPLGIEPKDLYLEFRKEGYQDRRVYLHETSTDPALSVTACPALPGCWEVNIHLAPALKH